MKTKPIWWIVGILVLISLFYILKVDHASKQEENKESLNLPKAPKQNRSIQVSPSKGEDPNSNEERKNIKPLS